jgi:SOS-response transcriptional repressor LexA
MYVYLTMLAYDTGECHPTIDEIREDLGLYSASMVFEALTVLEDLGFIVRERQSFPGVRAKRNVYRRTACEFTILRLIERNRIDAYLRPGGPNESPAAPESQELVQEGLRVLLDTDFERYRSATPQAKRDVLMEILDAAIKARPKGIVQ